ncbi:MAG TPA: hypothetical protein VNX02_10065 [Steroidobacteraceae bacterium]|jgi:hypothetical protein|nr:hypothetical protein [Steroidobacteraceae bacterium]
MTRVRILLCVLLAITPTLGVSADELPWVFNAPRAEGYSISLLSVSPAPGTPLVAGSSLKFAVAVSYTLTIAKHGVIVLVFQDETNASAAPGRPQVHHEVSDSAGVASLAEQLTVPSTAKELRVFIPLVPDGLVNTSGELTIRYPITGAPQ